MRTSAGSGSRARRRSGPLAFNTAAFAHSHAQLTPAQRQEAACAQHWVRGSRVGCCHLKCTAVEGGGSVVEGGDGGLKRAGLLRCSQCEVVVYCCRAFQEADLVTHKPACQFMLVSKQSSKS